ncbi:MAG: TlpA disulfide reductase family protein [Bacteroidota bacterium]
MRLYAALFFLFLLSCSGKSVESQKDLDSEEKGQIWEYEIIGNISNEGFESEKIFLYETEGKDIFLLDTASVNEGRFVFRLTKPEMGIYKIGIHRHDLHDFIINPIEEKIELVLNGTSFSRQMKHNFSEENDLYGQYQLEKQKHNQRISAVKREKLDRKTKLLKIRNEQEKLKEIEKGLAQKNPELFAAKIINIAQSPHRFDKDRYWNDIDFTDESLIHSSMLNDRIQDFMRSHGKGGLEGNDGFMNAVDFIYAISNKNERVMNFMLYAMMEGFYGSNMTEVSSYIIDNYIYGDACGTQEVSDLIKQKAQGIRSLEIGQSPPNFEINDEEGKAVRFDQVAGSNSYTALFFWASWCHKCENEIPMLKTTYETYSSQGFEVIGVALDKDEEAWRKSIQTKECNWINVSQLEEWQSPVVKDYRVNSTPAFFLVNDKKELVFKCRSAAALNNWLSRNIN